MSHDGYFKDHRHKLSKREEMRALELDPHHFYKVKPEPEHHERRYFSEHDARIFSDDEDLFYKDMDHPIDDKSWDDFTSETE